MSFRAGPSAAIAGSTMDSVSSNKSERIILGSPVVEVGRGISPYWTCPPCCTPVRMQIRNRILEPTAGVYTPKVAREYVCLQRRKTSTIGNLHRPEGGGNG